MRSPLNSAFALCLVSALIASSSTRAEIDIGVSTASYLGQGPESRQENYSSLTAGVDVHGRSRTLVSRSFIQSLVSFNDTGYRFIEAPELYVGSNPFLFSSEGERKVRGPMPREYFQITAGRKLENWNRLDQHWGLGAWQPRFRWDYLNPQQVGLMGLQLAGKKGIVKANLLYSPLFIPDRGAPIDFADGRISSISPWALNPPYTAVYRGRETQIRYTADIPEVMEVVQHHSLAGMIRVGEQTGFWGSVAMAYKPMNQLPMAYDPVIEAQKVPYINVKIYPRVTYHSLYSLDGGWSDANWDVWGSFLVDIPDDHYEFVPERMHQNVSRMSLFSPTVSYHLGRRSPYSAMMSLSYLKRFGEDLPDVGVDSNGRKATDAGGAFDSRYPYVDAVLLTARSPTIRNFMAETRLLVDLEDTGTILSWTVNYRHAVNWNFYVSADVLTSWSEESPEVGSDFIYRYRANDRVAGGVSYAF